MSGPRLEDLYAESDVDLKVEARAGEGRTVVRRSAGVAARMRHGTDEELRTCSVGASTDVLDGLPRPGRPRAALAEALAAPTPHGDAGSALVERLSRSAAHLAARLTGPDESVSLRVRCRDWTVWSPEGGSARAGSSIANVVWRTRSVEGPVETMWAGGLTEVGTPEHLEHLHALARRRTAARAAARRPPPGVADVVLSPVAAAAWVHELVGHSLEADRVTTGSRLWEERDTLEVSPLLRVCEHGAHPDAWDRTDVDEEGVPVSDTPLVAAGRVAGAVTSRATARLSPGLASTGGGRRAGYRTSPEARVRHTRVLPGPGTGDPLVAGLGAGILVTGLDGGQVDVRTGHFVLKVSRAWRVERGERQERLAGFALEGDLASLARVERVGGSTEVARFWCGRGTRWVPVSSSAPSLQVAALGVR